MNFDTVFYKALSQILVSLSETSYSLLLTGIWGLNLNQCGMHGTDTEVTGSCLAEMLHSRNRADAIGVKAILYPLRQESLVNMNNVF